MKGKLLNYFILVHDSYLIRCWDYLPKYWINEVFNLPTTCSVSLTTAGVSSSCLGEIADLLALLHFIGFNPFLKLKAIVPPQITKGIQESITFTQQSVGYIYEIFSLPNYLCIHLLCKVVFFAMSFPAENVFKIVIRYTETMESIHTVSGILLAYCVYLKHSWVLPSWL